MTDEQEFDPKDIAGFKTTLMQLNGVQAVGESIDDGRRCLKVYFLDEASMKTSVIPEAIGIPIVKLVSGSIQSQ